MKLSIIPPEQTVRRPVGWDNLPPAQSTSTGAAYSSPDESRPTVHAMSPRQAGRQSSSSRETDWTLAGHNSGLMDMDQEPEVEINWATSEELIQAEFIRLANLHQDPYTVYLMMRTHPYAANPTTSLHQFLNNLKHRLNQSDIP